jgi:uncharacterized protein (UPF0333 family)
MDLDFADIKPSLLNAVVILCVVIVGVPLLKFAFNKFNVPGVTQLVNAI